MTQRLPRKVRRDWKAKNGNGSGLCAICGDTERRTGLDHDHVTGKIRGVLCLNCNSGLGMFRDSPSLLRRAAKYLEVALTPETEEAIDGLLTVTEAAKVLRMSKQGVYSAVRAGQLPTLRIGQRIRLRRSDLLKTM